MKKPYIKPTSTIYQVGLREKTCQLILSSEYDEDDPRDPHYGEGGGSRQAREYNTSHTNLWDNEW